MALLRYVLECSITVGLMELQTEEIKNKNDQNECEINLNQKNEKE